MTDMSPGVLHVAFLRHAHPVLDLGEGLFDGVQVGGVWGQEPEPGAGGPDGVTDGLGLVTAEIIDNDDVAGVQGRDELLFHIGEEAGPVDGAVEDAGRGEPVASERRQEGHGAPFAMRGEADQALASRPPASERRHVGFDPCLVDEDQALRIEPGLQALPALPPAGDRGPCPLNGEQRFF